MLVFATVSFAQHPEMRAMMNHGDMRKKLDMVRRWKLLDDLNLTEEQSNKLLPILAARDRNRQTADSTFAALTVLVKEQMKKDKPDEKKLNGYIERLMELKSSQCQNDIDFYKDASKILSPVQQVKLLTFDERFREEMRRLIQDFKGRDRKRGEMPFDENNKPK